MSIAKKCSVDDCESVVSARKLCGKHYWKLRNMGDVQAPTIHDPRAAIVVGDIAQVPIGLNAKHGYATVDAQDAWIADKYRWTLDGAGYAMTVTGGKALKMHHLIIGRPAANLVTDHVNHDKLDNRRSNLRHVNHNINNTNLPIYSGNATGHLNIYCIPGSTKLSVDISRNRKRVFRKRFNTLDEAITARDKFLDTL